jgi:2-keto-4-pentenoate hydratase/2-oxohepta-3-ene-1,7-dioic acid hydratase in catechol pathway
LICTATSRCSGNLEQDPFWGPFWEWDDDGTFHLRVGKWVLGLGTIEQKAAVENRTAIPDTRAFFEQNFTPDAKVAAMHRRGVDRLVVSQPRTVRDFSAFEEHCRTGLRALGVDLSDKWFEIPVFYFGNANSVIGADDPVVPPGNTEKLDYELEVGLIVGEGGIDLDPATAADRIAGLCIFNDWSARDLQNEEMALVPIGPAKGKDFANGLGPYLVTLDELADRTKDGAYDLAMTASVNGKAYTKGNLADIYWSLGQLVAYASRGARLYPGDVIGTGTCGTGCILELSLVHGSQAYPWLKEGDEVVLEVERLGAMHSRIKAGVPVTPLK